MTIIQHKRGISTNWTSSNPVLTVSEIGYETDTGKFKIGDGTSTWSALPYFSTSSGGSGTVTSVTLTVPTGLTVSGSPITTSGTLAVSFDTGYSIPTTAKQTEWDTAYGWGNHASAGYQAGDAELTAIAGLTSAADRLPYFTGSGTASLATFTSFGRSLVDDADASDGRTTLGLGTMATQASTSYAALSGATFTGNVLIQTAGAASLSIGRVDGTSSTPYIDFNSGATAIDYDSRILASGGTGTNGEGNLTFYAASSSFSGDVGVNGGDLTTSTTGTASLFNTNATTINIGGAATTITIGAGTGNVNFNDNISAEGYITARRASNQDSVRLLGRAGGTSNYDAILTPTTLTATRTITIPDATGTILLSTDIGSTVQAYDADLTDIAALSANGLLRKTAGTWGMDTATYLTSYTETDTLSSVTGRGATTNSAISITDATSSTTTTTGALKVTGGVGIVENLNVGGNLAITGNLTVNGTTTTINSTIVTVDDPIFTLGGDTAPGSDDNKDRGIAFRWHNGVSSKIGFFGFDDSTQYFTFVPDATITSEVISGSTGTFDGSITGNAASATSATSATSADTVKTVSTATNASFYPTFVDANNGTATSEALYTDAGITYNPSTNTITATTFSGALSGNASTASSAAIWTTARNLAGNSVDGSGPVAFANKFIVQGTTDTGLSGAQFLGALGTGIIKNTTTTGVLSIAVAGDFPTLNQNTTGSAATLTTARDIWGQSFNGSGNVTGSLTSVGDITGSTTMAITAGTASNISLNAGSIAGTTGTGGTVTISSGNGGSTSGAGGAISIDTGTSVGVGGAISIGTANASGITIGRSGTTTTIAGTLNATVSTATSADTAKTVSTATDASFYPVFVDANNGTATSETLYTDAGLVYNPSTNKLSTGGDLSVNGGDLETTSTGTASLFNTNATTLNIGGGATTAVNIGNASGLANFASAVDLRAGGTAANTAPLYFSSSTSVLDTPVAGAVEYNNANFFATPFTTSGRGLIESNYFYSNQGTISIAGTSTGGAAISGSAFAVSLPLATSTAYQIEATMYLQTSYSTNAPASQTMTFSYPTGTTILAEGIIVQNVAAATTQSTAGSFYAMQANTNRTMTAVTTSGNWHRISMRGIIRTSTNAGSFSINFGGTNGATPATLQLTLGANSFIKLTPVGSATSDNSIGAWA